MTVSGRSWCSHFHRRRSTREPRDKHEARDAGTWRYCRYNSNTHMCHKYEILNGASNEASSLESQMDASAGGNESTPTVTVTWEKKNEEGERDDVKKKSKGGKQMIIKVVLPRVYREWSIAVFPSMCFYAHFEVLHEKKLKEMALKAWWKHFFRISSDVANI